MEIFYAILQFLSGIGVFLFGIKTMSYNLGEIAGEKLKTVLSTFTKNRFLGVLTGILVTFLMQSSTATTTMVVSLVNAGVLSLYKAIGVIFGSNIGTVFTQILIGFDVIKLTSIFASLTCIFAIIYVTTKKRKLKRVMECLTGFGLVFVGIMLIGNSTLVNELFAELILSISNPLFLLLIGFVFTIIVQSSLGAVVVLMGIVSVSPIPIVSLGFIIIGINIGTTLTALLASIGGSMDSKRVAITHIGFSLFGGTLFSILLLLNGLNWLSYIPSIKYQIVVFNLMFNIITCLMLLPFTREIHKFLTKTFRIRKPPKQFREKTPIACDIETRQEIMEEEPADTNS